MAESMKKKVERCGKIEAILRDRYPEGTALYFETPFQLLVATILSAQCTDERVNKVTPALFERFSSPAAFAKADIADLESLVHSTGFFRQKARAIKEGAAAIVERFGGRMPLTMEELVTLPGVGRKTANVVLGNTMGTPGIVVDTHVKRVAFRMGLTANTDPEKIETDLQALLPPERWTGFSNSLIRLGREVCTARKVKCAECPVEKFCVKNQQDRLKSERHES